MGQASELRRGRPVAGDEVVHRARRGIAALTGVEQDDVTVDAADGEGRLETCRSAADHDHGPFEAVRVGVVQIRLVQIGVVQIGLVQIGVAQIGVVLGAVGTVC